MEDVLKRRNFHGPSRCVLCRQEEETVHHLLVHCQWASSFWQLGLSLTGVSWVQPWKAKDVLFAWSRRRKKCLAFGVWKLIPLAMVVGLEGKKLKDFLGQRFILA